MKLSRLLHVTSVVVGFAGIITAFAGVQAGATDLVWGLTREHLFLCSGLLMLIAIWAAIGAIHHMMLEEKGEIV